MNDRLLKHFIYLFVLLTQIQGFANPFLDNFNRAKIDLMQDYIHPYFKIDINKNESNILKINSTSNDILEIIKSSIINTTNGGSLTTENTIKNGTLVTYNVEIKNKSGLNTIAQFEELFKINNTILNKYQIEFVSWQFPNNSSYPTTLLAVDAENKLKGNFIVQANQSVVVSITLKLNAIIVTNFNAISNVVENSGNEDVLNNNTQTSNVVLVINSNDLGVISYVDNPNSTQGDNVFTIRLINTGLNTITAGSGNIKIELSLSSTTTNIIVVNTGDFTYNTPTLATNNITLNSGISLSPGQFREFKFRKDNFSDSGTNQVRTHTFTLTYTDDNANNNISTVTHRNAPNPGAMSLSNSSIVNEAYACFDGTITIYNSTSATSTITAASIMNSYQISYDGGLTWNFIKKGAVKETNLSGNTLKYLTIDLNYDESLNESSDNVNYTHKVYSLPSTALRNVSYVILQNIKKNISFRRYSFNENQQALNAFTNSIKIYTEENKINFIGSNMIAIPKGGSFNFPAVTTTLQSTLSYYDQNNNSVSSTNLGSDLQEGEYLYKIKATTTSSTHLAGCEKTEFVRVIVYNPSSCFAYTKRTFGTIVKGWTSGLSGYRELEKVTDGNRADAGELNGGVVLLGLGTVGMDIFFTKPDGSLYSGAELKGKKVVIKLGEQYSGLKVAGGLSVVGRLTNNGVTAQTVTVANSSQAGATFGVKGGVLDALKGDNVFEYSFIPASSITSSGSPVEFNGIRIQLGSLIGVADLANVFYAYMEEDRNLTTDFGSNTQSYCASIAADIRVTPPSGMAYPTLQNDIDLDLPQLGPIANTNFKLNRSVEDAFWGNYSEVLNVASSLNPVIYPYYAVDDDYDSYSIFSTTVGALNAQFLQAKLRQKARLGDQVQITLSYPNISVLNLSLLQLGNFKIVYYLNGAKVGEERLEEFRVLDIGLFRFRDKRRAILSKPVNFMFDKVELTQFSVVNLNFGEGLRIHDIRINPLNAFAGMTDPKQVTQLCATAPVVIQKMDPCTEYEISFARVTEFGPEYLKADNTPLLDYKGRSIRSIYAVEDIPNSTLTFLRNDETGSLSYYSHNRTTLFHGPDYDGKLLIKIKTKRQGCDFGEPQYLRVDLENCIQGTVNPIIMNSAKF